MFKRMNPIILEYGPQFKAVYKEIYKTIEKYDRIVLFRHIKPDYDAMGSQMGLYQFLKDNFPKKEIHYVGDNHVTYTPRLFPETERLTDSFFREPFLAIIMDVGDKERVADPRYERAETIIKIDHHPCKKEIAHLNVLDKDAAAAAELVADLLLKWKGKKITKEAARHLYVGIVGDSGRFRYSSTSTHTFAVAEELLSRGINLPEIYKAMYEKKLEDLQVTAYILNHFSVSPHGVAYYVLTKEVQDQYNITSERGKENVNLFSNINGIEAWCSITEDPNPKDYCWRISLRSKMKDISGIADKWQGGGHAQAAGAKLNDISELDAFIKDMDDLFA